MKKYLNQIHRKGYLILNNIYSKRETHEFKIRLEKILINRIKKNKKTGNSLNQVMYSYFNDDPYLLKLIYNPQIDKILKKILDENYVLQSSNAQNRLLNKYKINKKSRIEVLAILGILIVNTLQVKELVKDSPTW